MNDDEKLKIYMTWADISRKWVSTMDSKAAFLSALNAGLLGFIWTGAKLVESNNCSKWFALCASMFSFASLFSALYTVLPRWSLRQIFGSNSRYVKDFKAVSFYGFVASHYPKGTESNFFSDVAKMDALDLNKEALEQHFTISHALQIKSNWVRNSGWLLLMALSLTVVGLLVKVFY